MTETVEWWEQIRDRPTCECCGKLKSGIWIDGGYDRKLVEECEYHPDHRWEVVRVGDVVAHPYEPDELHVICRGCFVPRCGHSTETNPCMLPRHHAELHAYADGTYEDDSVWPGSEKPDA